MLILELGGGRGTSARKKLKWVGEMMEPCGTPVWMTREAPAPGSKTSSEAEDPSNALPQMNSEKPSKMPADRVSASNSNALQGAYLTNASGAKAEGRSEFSSPSTKTAPRVASLAGDTAPRFGGEVSRESLKMRVLRLLQEAHPRGVAARRLSDAFQETYGPRFDPRSLLGETWPQFINRNLRGLCEVDAKGDVALTALGVLATDFDENCVIVPSSSSENTVAQELEQLRIDVNAGRAASGSRGAPSLSSAVGDKCRRVLDAHPRGVPYHLFQTRYQEVLNEELDLDGLGLWSVSELVEGLGDVFSKQLSDGQVLLLPTLVDSATDDEGGGAYCSAPGRGAAPLATGLAAHLLQLLRVNPDGVNWSTAFEAIKKEHKSDLSLNESQKVLMENLSLFRMQYKGIGNMIIRLSESVDPSSIPPSAPPEEPHSSPPPLRTFEKAEEPTLEECVKRVCESEKSEEPTLEECVKRVCESEKSEEPRLEECVKRVCESEKSEEPRLEECVKRVCETSAECVKPADAVTPRLRRMFKPQTVPSMSMQLLRLAPLHDARREFIGKISQYNSPDSFYVVLESEEDSLNTLMADLDALYASERGLAYAAAEVEEGMPCAVPYADFGYHRAIVLDLSDPQHAQMFVDYGTLDQVPRSCIKYLTLDFLDRLPAQAIHCRLHGIRSAAGPGQAWPEGTAEAFSECVTKEDGVKLVLIDYQESDGKFLVEVVLPDSAGYMSEVLVHKQLALPLTPIGETSFREPTEPDPVVMGATTTEGGSGDHTTWEQEHGPRSWEEELERELCSGGEEPEEKGPEDWETEVADVVTEVRLGLANGSTDETAVNWLIKMNTATKQSLAKELADGRLTANERRNAERRARALDRQLRGVSDELQAFLHANPHESRQAAGCQKPLCVVAPAAPMTSSRLAATRGDAPALSPKSEFMERVRRANAQDPPPPGAAWANCTDGQSRSSASPSASRESPFSTPPPQGAAPVAAAHFIQQPVPVYLGRAPPVYPYLPTWSFPVRHQVPAYQVPFVQQHQAHQLMNTNVPPPMVHHPHMAQMANAAQNMNIAQNGHLAQMANATQNVNMAQNGHAQSQWQQIVVERGPAPLSWVTLPPTTTTDSNSAEQQK